MIEYNPKTWLQLIFHAYTRHVVRRLFPSLAFIGVYTTGLAVAVCEYHLFEVEAGIQVHSLIGIVLGLFLVFRTNTAYDRWWEGRKQWGALVNNCRNFAIKLDAMLAPSAHEDRDFFAKMIANYVFAMKEHLRHGVQREEMDFPAGSATEHFEKFEHKPNAIASVMYRRLQSLVEKGQLTGEQLFLLDKEIKAFTDIIGACERIKNTPIPYSYSMFMKKFIFIYIMTLPFGFITKLEYWTIPAVLFLFYIFVSIELIAEEIEDPFGHDENDLPTDELSVKIRANVAEILSAANAPSVPQA